MLCKFQVYSKVNQLYIYIYVYTYTYIHSFLFSDSFPMYSYRVLSRVPCAIWQVLTSYLFYIFANILFRIFATMSIK